MVVAATLAAAPAFGQTNDLAAVVAQFYPASLDADTAAIAAGQAGVRHQCWVALRTDAGGAATLVLAAYTNSQSGAVRVLAKETSGASGFVLADQAAGASIGGSTCRAETVDVDADGALEGVVRFGTRTGTNDWVYAWHDGALADLSPLTVEGVPIPVVSSEFVDLDGDGMLELRSGSRRFRLLGGSYVLIP